MSENYSWHPATPAQKSALDSQADILFFGGAAGSLKTATMLMDAVQEYLNPNLRAIIFRSSYAEMTDILDKTNSMFPPLGGTYVGSPKYTWTFKSGAKIRFGYVKTDEDWRKYLGPRYCVARNTLILMGDGSYRSIESIGVGELVQTMEGPKPVTAVHGPFEKECVGCITEHGMQVHPVDHPILLSSGEWGSYASLKDGQTFFEASYGHTQETAQPQALSVRIARYVPDPLSDFSRTHSSIQFRLPCKSLARSARKYLNQKRGHSGHRRPSSQHLPLLGRSTELFACDTSYAQLGSRRVAGFQSSYPACPHPHDGPPRYPLGISPGAAPSPAYAAPHIRLYRRLDVPDTSLERIHAKALYSHPYSGKQRERICQLDSSWALMTPVGAKEVFDLTVADANHYITRQGSLNRNSFIGWDESTQHTEKQVRNLLGRLSSTDKRLRLRCRLGSNPGGVGASWHQEVFLRGPFCPVHNPNECAIPGKLYTDRKWSDGKPIPFSVSFIPGKLSDHHLLDADYSKRLNMMAGGDAAAMELGCWCKLEGAYFPFMNSGLIKPIADCGIEWWHNHFISIDYGYGQSWAAAGLYVRSPGEVRKKISIPGIDPALLQEDRPVFAGGRIRKIAEILVPMTPVDRFAQMIVDSFVAPGEGEERRCIIAVFADPANFNPMHDERVGTGGHSVSDQIDKVLEPWGLVCQRASTQRAAGWQLVYRMLRDGEFEITNMCPQTYESLRTRMIDPKKSGDILKVEGSELDDVADETRYALFTFVNPADKPRDLQLAEHIANIDRSTREGMTSSAIRYEQKSQELDRLEEPIRMSGMRRLGMRRR